MKTRPNLIVLFWSLRAAAEDGIRSLDCKQPLHFNILLSTPVNSKFFIKNLDRYQVVDIAISQKTQLTYMYTFFWSTVESVVIRPRFLKPKEPEKQTED